MSRIGGRSGRGQRMLIAMAGLPGSGKSTIATCLERELGAIVLDKDRVRAALFPPRVLDYSAGQDDITMAAIYQAVRAIHKANAGQTVVIDGRTYLRPGQVRSLLSLISYLGSGEYREKYLGLKIPPTNLQDYHLEQARGFAAKLADQLVTV